MSLLVALVFPFVVDCGDVKYTIREIVDTTESGVHVRYEADLDGIFAGRFVVGMMPEPSWEIRREAVQMLATESFKQMACRNK